MIKYTDKKTITKILDEVVCDKCGKVFHSNDLDIQEVHCIDFTGGYSSIFGDGVNVKCDLCQHCIYEMIKDFCTYT